LPDPEKEEMKKLRRQLKDAEQERDILKKALAIFSRLCNRGLKPSVKKQRKLQRLCNEDVPCTKG
jgi:transposase-like protein